MIGFLQETKSRKEETEFKWREFEREKIDCIFMSYSAITMEGIIILASSLPNTQRK